MGLVSGRTARLPRESLGRVLGADARVDASGLTPREQDECALGPAAGAATTSRSANQGYDQLISDVRTPLGAMPSVEVERDSPARPLCEGGFVDVHSQTRSIHRQDGPVRILDRLAHHIALEEQGPE